MTNNIFRDFEENRDKTIEIPPIFIVVPSGKRIFRIIITLEIILSIKIDFLLVIVVR